MTDINYEIRQSYKSLLAGINISGNNVPVYYSQLPAGDDVNEYVLINSITSTGFNTDCSNMMNTNVQLMIVTKAFQNNSGANCDNIAGQILNIIIPSPRAKAVQITSGQVISTDLSMDRAMTGLTDGQKKLINRILGFQHIISHN